MKAVVPYKKSSTRTYVTKKKTTKKPSIPRNPNPLVTVTVPGRCPVPDVYNCQFTFSAQGNMQANGSNNYSAQYIFAANSLYDPQVTGAGLQPYYYDQLIAPAGGTTGIYKTYKVKSSSIDVEVSCSSNNTVPTYVWLLPISSDNASLGTVPPDLDEYPRSKRITLTASGGSVTTSRLNNYLPIYVHENITANDWNVNDYDYQGKYTSSPQNTCYWYIVAQPAANATTVHVYFRVKMTYYCELSERNQELDYS